MNKEVKNLKATSPTLITFAYSAAALFLLICYLLIYQYTPFAGSLNDWILNSIITLASFFVAVVATVNYLQYHPDDYPRKVWLNLMIGSWFWFLAELIWGVFYFTLGEFSSPSIADAGWVGGFIFFTIAFYHQYVIVSPSQQKAIRNIAFGIWVVVLLTPLIILLAVRKFTVESYINYWYSLADLAVGIVGLMLVFVFQGGKLMRPWLGLVVFGISDFFYAWAEQTGIYAWSTENSNLFTLAIDLSYLAAYLILGLGFISHLILIRYGLRADSE